MIGYIFHSIGFGLGDLLLFVFSILAGAWVVRSWRRGARSRTVRLVKVFVMLLALVPFLMLVLAFLRAKSNAPAAITAQSAPNLQETAMNMGPNINTRFREAEPSFTADGQTMYFNCHNADICVSHLIGSWEEGKWTAPERLEAPISTGYFEIEPLINATGDNWTRGSWPTGRTLVRGGLRAPGRFFHSSTEAAAEIDRPTRGHYWPEPSRQRPASAWGNREWRSS